MYLVPAMQEYQRHPTRETWAAARDRVEATKRRVEAAIQSAIDYDASLVDTLGPDLRSLHGELQAKSVQLANVPANPPGPAWVDGFDRDYLELVGRLNDQLVSLRSTLLAAK